MRKTTIIFIIIFNTINVYSMQNIFNSNYNIIIYRHSKAKAVGKTVKKVGETAEAASGCCMLSGSTIEAGDALTEKNQNEKIKNFVAKNMKALDKDIASGQGEYLNTLADLMKIKNKDKNKFNSLLKNNYLRIYTSEKITADQVVININNILKEYDMIH